MALPFSPPPPPAALVNPNLDPNLVPRIQQPHLSPPNNNQAAQLPNRMRNNQSGQMNGSPLQGNMMQSNVPGFQSQSNMWSGGFDNGGGIHEAHSPSDTWSNSSLQGPAVPTTLNVEDWFQFFGINSDLSMSNDIPLGEHSFK